VTLPWTLALLIVGLTLAGLARWHESRPRELEQVGLFPTTLVLAVGVIAAVLAVAHLVTLLTGFPLTGRYGR
jgi:preprotein translocase subunit Sec61beta